MDGTEAPLSRADARANDAINPSHYGGFSNGAKVIDIVERLNFNRGNAIKYIARAGRKPGADTVEDLKKAKWYLEREIARIIADGKETGEAIVSYVYVEGSS